MQYFFLGIALLVAFLLIGRWFVEADPRKVVTAVKWGIPGLLAVVGLLLVVSGRIGLIFLLLPLMFWLRRIVARAKAARGPAGGQSSEVRTRFLQMTLDHDSGAMDGQILDGRHAGQLLSELDLAALLELLQDYAVADQQSASVLEAYLDRTQADDWRAAAGDERGYGGTGNGSANGRENGGQERTSGGGVRPGAGAMSRQEALEVLGLEEGVSSGDIREAHRRLIRKLHPDHGGSNYLAAKLNEAKDLLLRH